MRIQEKLDNLVRLVTGNKFGAATLSCWRKRFWMLTKITMQAPYLRFIIYPGSITNYARRVMGNEYGTCEGD